MECTCEEIILLGEHRSSFLSPYHILRPNEMKALELDEVIHFSQPFYIFLRKKTAIISQELTKELGKKRTDLLLFVCSIFGNERGHGSVDTSLLKVLLKLLLYGNIQRVKLKSCQMLHNNNTVRQIPEDQCTNPVVSNLLQQSSPSPILHHHKTRCSQLQSALPGTSNRC